MESTARLDEEQQRDRLGLLGLTLGLAATATILYKLAGPPHLPTQLPSWQTVITTLQSSDVPLEALAYIFTSAAWLLWLWITASLVLHVCLALADRVTQGAQWVRTLHVLVDPLTLPWVRRVVDGALVAAFVVNLATWTTLAAAAAPATPVVVVAGMSTYAPSPLPQEAAPEVRQGAVEYTVQASDTLWTIAERFYGTGEEFPRLVDANDGRVMPDGGHFTRAGVIRPGWRLLVPLPSDVVEEVDGRTYYTVEAGDTLWGIAARFLGDPMRWSEIFELNRGVTRHPQYGWTLTQPNLIWPGLRLQLPVQVAENAEPPQPAPAPVMPAAPETPPVPPPPAPATPAEPTPVVASPTPTSVAVTPPPTPVAAEPTLLPTPVVAPQSPDQPGNTTSPLVWGAIALGTAAAAGAALTARRRVRRSLSEPPVPREEDELPNRGFVEAELARALAHRLQGGEAEAATLVAEAVTRFLQEQGVDDVAVLSVQQGRDRADVTLSAGLRRQARILELAEEMGRHLGGTAKATPTADHDILLQLTGLKLTRLLAPSPAQRDAAWLAPIGVIPKRDTLYANWRELGHILVAGSPGGGTDVVLTSLLSALAARTRPGEVAWWTVANERLLPAQLARLPHQRRGFIDPTHEGQVEHALADLQGQLDGRMQASPAAVSWPAAEPDVVLAIGELADVGDYDTALDTLATHGLPYGMRLVAATSQPEALSDEMLALFNTRCVLQTLDEEQSIRLLGRPDAADLSHGEMLLRLDGRTPLWARGFRVSPEHLDQLLRLMHEAAPTSVPGEPPSPSRGVDPAPAEHRPLPLHPVEEEPEPDDTSSPVASAQAERNDDGAVEDEVIVQGQFPLQTGPSVEETLPTEPIPDPLALEEQVSSPGELAPYPPSSNGHHPLREATIDASFVTDVEPLADAAGDAPLIYVQCFGEFVVRSGTRRIRPQGKAAASYIAWEALAFLATYPDAAVPREKLIGALWPDVESGVALGRLRHTLNKLRNILRHQVPGLTGEIVQTERDDTRRLDEAIVRSDAQAFLALCRAARKLRPAEARPALEQALALYRGDLFAEGAASSFAWVEDRMESGVTLREFYRTEYDQATLRLARLYYEAGQAALAVPLYKRLLRAEPTLEDIVRDLYRCYHQLGDLSALIREDHHLREALRKTYHTPNGDVQPYEPERETVTLFNAIRDKLESSPLPPPSSS